MTDSCSEEESIFEAAIQADSESERQAILESLCAGKPALRKRVEDLLNGYARGQSLEMASHLIDISSAFNGLEGKQVGPYRVLERIGEGGMGEVYLAKPLYAQDQPVALKCIKPGMDTRQVIARFELERRSLQRLNHPNIARFIDSGVSENGRAYFVMELVRGFPITQYCRHFRLPIEERLRLFVDACRAIHHANSMGLIHRDIKPNNLLVSRVQDIATVKVIDFGITKALTSEISSDSIFTGALHWLGTPEYMSPEQALWSHDVDARSDVYSLGIILYEMLTGANPIATLLPSTKGLNGVRDLIIEHTPPRPSRALRAMPLGTKDPEVVELVDFRPELDWIVLKAIQKRPEDRYLSAEQFAEDVVAYLQCKPILAKRSRGQAVMLFFRKASRYRGQWAVWALLVVLMAVGLANNPDLLRRGKTQTSVADKSSTQPGQGGSDEAKASIDEQSQLQPGLDAVTALSIAKLREAAHLKLIGKNSEAMRVLEVFDRPDHPWKEHFVTRYLKSTLAVPEVMQASHVAFLQDMDMTADRRTIVTCCSEGEIKFWDGVTQQLIQTRRPSSSEVKRVRFAPDGQFLASSGQDRVVRIWNARDATLVAEQRVHSNTVNGLAWSPDGQMLATGDRGGIVCIWKAPTLELVTKLHCDHGPVRAIAWAPDQKSLATADGDFGIHIWSSKDWSRRSYVSTTNNGGPLDISYAPDSKHLASGGHDGEILVLSLLNNNLTRLKLRASIHSVCFNDSMQLLLGTSDGTIVTLRMAERGSWEVMRTQVVSESPEAVQRIVMNDRDDLVHVALERSSTVLSLSQSAVCGYETVVGKANQVGNLSEVQRSFEFDFRSAELRSTADGHLKETLKTSGPLHLVVPAYLKSLEALCVVGNKGKESRLQVWQRENQQLVRDRTVHLHVRYLLACWGGSRVLAAGNHNTPLVWDPTADEIIALRTSQGSQSNWVCASNPTRDEVAAAPVGSMLVECFSARSGEKLAEITAKTPVQCLHYAPNGDELVIGGQNEIAAWSTPDGIERWHVPLLSIEWGLAPVKKICFSPDHTTLVAYHGGGLHFIDCQTRSEIFTLPVHLFGIDELWWLGFENPNHLALGYGRLNASVRLHASPAGS